MCCSARPSPGPCSLRSCILPHPGQRTYAGWVACPRTGCLECQCKYANSKVDYPDLLGMLMCVALPCFEVLCNTRSTVAIHPWESKGILSVSMTSGHSTVAWQQQPLTECQSRLRSSGCCVNTLTLPALDDSRCGTSTLAWKIQQLEHSFTAFIGLLPRWALWHSL